MTTNREIIVWSTIIIANIWTMGMFLSMDVSTVAYIIASLLWLAVACMNINWRYLNENL